MRQVAFVEVAPDVHVLRYPVLDVNVSLILGGETALLVDTLSTQAQATELIAAVRQVTAAPLIVANTHAHFDHCFGNETMARVGARIWAHEHTAYLLRAYGDDLRRAACEVWGPTSLELATGLPAVRIRPPDHEVSGSTTLDLGGRIVTLAHLGRGHTAGDLIVLVPDAKLIVAGDLVEESGPPQFEDAFPLQWARTLAAMLADPCAQEAPEPRAQEASGSRAQEAPGSRAQGVPGPRARIVPGHGAVVEREFVVGQHQQLTVLANLIRAGQAAGDPVETVAAAAPFDNLTAQTAVARGYAELAADETG